MREHRLQSLTRWLKQQHFSCAFLTSSQNIFYLSGFYHDPHERLMSLLLFPDQEPILCCPNMEMVNVRGAGWNYPILGYDDTENPWLLLKTEIQKRGISIDSIAVEKGHLSFERGGLLQDMFPQASIFGAEEKLNELRVIKDDKEIALLREAAKFADMGIEIGIQALEVGKTELEILSLIEFELKKQGIRDMAFSTLVLAGDKTASPHGIPTANPIKSGDFVLLDLGVVLDGYCSDITRTVIVGEPSDEQIDIYHTVLKAQVEAVHSCKPGIEIGSIDRIARQIITDKGYGDYFIHRIGHGLGINVHEYPSMTSQNKELFQEGMIFTVEPGVYLPEIGGVRIEDDVLITKTGMELLTNFPKELKIMK